MKISNKKKLQKLQRFQKRNLSLYLISPYSQNKSLDDG